MMTKEETKVAVYAELRSRNLAKPFGAADLLAFCKEINGRLEFRTQSEALSDIKGWTALSNLELKLPESKSGAPITTSASSLH
jgi:hypothetical protein